MVINNGREKSWVGKGIELAVDNDRGMLPRVYTTVRYGNHGGPGYGGGWAGVRAECYRWTILLRAVHPRTLFAPAEGWTGVPIYHSSGT